MNPRARQLTGVFTILIWCGIALMVLSEGRWWLGALCVALAGLRAVALVRSLRPDDDES